MPELRLRGGEVDGLDLHYLVEGRGPAVVLVHGLGGFAESWRHTLGTLAGRTTVYALVGGVVPGFGYRPSWIYRLVALPLIGEMLSLCGSAGLYKTALARCFHRAVREEVDFFVDFGFTERTSPGARAAYLATLRHVRVDFEAHAPDYRRAIATLDLPVLLIHGRQDRVVPPTHCAQVAEGFARATVRWVDECGHFPQIERAETVNRWLVDFLVGRTAPR